ncbi:MAG: hypothetical protein ACYCO9_16915 [Streptosporangiaceae bacterium]
MNKTNLVARAAICARHLPAALARRICPATKAGDPQAGVAAQKRRISRRERAARAAIGMPPGHPELLTRKPGRAEWRHLAAWITELWPRDEYTAIVTDAWRRDHP